MKKNAIKSEKAAGTLIFKIICCAILCLYVLSLILTFGWGLINSVKDSLFFNVDPLLFSKNGTEFAGNMLNFANYIDAINNFKVTIASGMGQKVIGFPVMALYSVIYAFGAALLQTVSCCAMAYICAKYDFKFSKVIYVVVVFTMVMPIIGALPSELQVLTALGIYNSFAGSFAIAFNFQGLHFMVFHAMFKSVPKDYTEASMLDGAGHWRIFLSIILPLAKNVFLTLFLLKFIVFWNDYQTPLVYMPSFPTLAYGLQRFNFAAGPVSTVPHKLAGCFIVFLPIFIIFIFMHNKLMGNISVGGIKG